MQDSFFMSSCENVFMELFSQDSQTLESSLTHLNISPEVKKFSSLCPFYLNLISKPVNLNNCFDFRTFLQKITEKKEFLMKALNI